MPKQHVDLEKIKVIAASLFSTPQSVFDGSLGVDERCLSARQIVDFVRGGATNESLEHLLGCEVCMQNLSRLATIRLESDRDFVAGALMRGFATKAEAAAVVAIDHTESSLTAVLGLWNDVIPVTEPKGDLVLKCAVIPAFGRELLGKIRPQSLRLDGALIAQDGMIQERVDVNDDGETDYLTVKFERARLAPRVRHGLIANQRVVDTVRLHGLLGTDTPIEFVGQAKLEFVPDLRFGVEG